MDHAGHIYRPFEIVIQLYIEKNLFTVFADVIRMHIKKLEKENDVKCFAFIKRLSESLYKLVWCVFKGLVKWIFLFCDSFQLSYFRTTKVLCNLIICIKNEPTF